MFEPFDITYEKLTKEIKDLYNDIGKIQDPTDRQWLQTLTEQFIKERESWEENKDLDDYREQCEKLRGWRALQLIAGAYLHISYDLPRVIANNWPKASAEEFRREQIYLRLAEIFGNVFKVVTRDRRVLGYPFLLIRFLPKGVLDIATHWVLHLRAIAWIHARQLHNDPPGIRESRERALLKAMVNALKHTSILRPLPHPPQSSLLMQIAATVPSIALIGQHNVQLKSFVGDFGRRVYQYTSAAMIDPEGFTSYLKEREQEIHSRKIEPT
jgi:hypothetical protein